MLVLPDSWLDRWKDRDVFEQLFALEGKVYREQKGRKTLGFPLNGKQYFGKFHSGVGWKEIVKNLFQFRLPIFGARNEWRAIKHLDQLGIKTMSLVGYGKRGWNPARLQSFVITEDLTDTVSLENFCRDWTTSPPDFTLKQALIKEVATIARKLHQHGMNHRDFYICHFLLDISNGMETIGPNSLRLYLIDLHRVQIRGSVPRRWRVKDIAALYFSSMDIGLTQRDILRFIRIYENKPLRESIKEDRGFWWNVKRRGTRLYNDIHKKDAGNRSSGN